MPPAEAFRLLFSFVLLLCEFAEFIELLKLCAAGENDEGALFYLIIRRLALAPAKGTNARDNSRALYALRESADKADCVLVVILFDFCVYRRHRRYITIKGV